MTGNEIKVKISAENMDFLRKMQDCIQAISKVDKAAKSASSGAGTNKTAPLPSRGASTSAPLPSGLGTKGSPISAGTGGFFDGFLGGAAKASMAIAGLTYALGKVKDIAAAIVMPGFEYTKEMETAQLGIAGILTSMTNLDGKAMDFSSAMGISADIMKKLQMDAILTSATTEEMVTTFRALLAPGIGAGMDVDEIREFTKVGVNAVKAMGLNSTQFVQELRDLVQGGIQASSSTLATSLGLTDADIKKAKASSEGLFKFLMNQMQGFKPMAEEFPKTLTGKLSMLSEFSTLASAKITESFTPEIKAALDLVTGLIATVNNDTKQIEFNPKILEFVDMLKNGADEVIEIFGAMNEKTGKFDVNPSVLSFFDELGDGLKSLWDLAMSLGKTFDQIFNDESFSLVQEFWLPVLADLWSIFVDITDIVKDVITVIGNLADAVIDVTGPFHKELSGALVWAVEKLKDFIHYAKQGWDMLAKLSGKGATKEPEKKRSDWRKKSEEQEKSSSGRTGNITAKNESRAQKEAAEKAEKERIKASQKTLKEMLKYWQRQLDSIQREYKKQQDALKLRLDQKAISRDKFYETSLKADIAKKEKEIEIIKGKIKAAESSEYKTEDDRKSRLDPLYEQRDTAVVDLKDLTKAMNEMVSVMEKMNTMTPEQAIKKLGLDPAGFDGLNGNLSQQPLSGEGNTWHRVAVENPKYDALESNAKQALEAVAAYFKQLTGQQLELTSGKRSADLGYAAEEIGGHGSGMKFDATAKALNDPEIRQKVIDFAKSVGLEVLDEYAKPTTYATGKHLDFNARNFKAPKPVTINEDLGELETREAYDMYTARMAMREKAKGLLAQYQGFIGDISTYQIDSITKQYKDLRKELTLYPNDDKAREALAVLDKLEAGEKAKVNFTQVQHDLENANEDLADAQNLLFTEFETGSKSSADVANELAAKFHELFDSKLNELNNQLEEALERGNDEDVRKIRRQLKESIDKMVDGFKALLDKIDAQTNEEINRIQLRKDLTSGQKDDLVEEVRQRGLRTKIGAAENQISEWNLQKETATNPEEIKSIDLDIANAKKQLEQFNYELSQTPTYIDKIGLAGKQGLEDGLNGFFMDLATGCKNASDAFKDLANSILQSITKVIANRLTQQFMSFVGLGAKPSGGGAGNGIGNILGLASGGSIDGGGKVTGPGTSTSDSILAWSSRFGKLIGLSDEEYVIKAKAVKKFGTRFMDYINNGMIPPEIYKAHEMYANGGSLSGISTASPANYVNKGDNIISVPVNIAGTGSPKMSSELRNEIEDVVIRVLRKYS